ncbi:MAG: glycine--tRNA ligase subunit beta, partial [Acidobacteriales bacterium]|nr:glycine--tRNA ligase subunit beta [Terriglobales bacterium]
MPELLLEIGCEEIPARMLNAACAELADRVGNLLRREHLGETATGFCTPRRLAVLANVIPRQPDCETSSRGPSLKVAYKDGQPTRAAESFAAKAGIRVDQLQEKDGYLTATILKKGRESGEILGEFLPQEIGSLYWPKNMYWRKASERFVRPVRWLVAMLDRQVLPLEFAGIVASDVSRGHRILAHHPVKIPSAAAYVATLREAKVLGREEREERIRKDLDAVARRIPGARWREDKELLDTVVNLTEFPSAILGNFDRDFLDLPAEVLVTVMRDHQKYFALEDANGKLLPHFLAALNTDGDITGVIAHGHERVLRARFNDARFFWQTDQKHSLRERAKWLKTVTFQKDLGSYYEKTKRVQRLCSWLCESIKQNGVQVRPGVVHKAALLAKADLTTELVKEFTELQGIVGGLYACAQQLDSGMSDSTRQAIADAIYDHYKPESMEDSVPRTVEGAVLSIGDKADTIAGMFALGLQPTGSKDPFALRRQANGIVKTIAEKKLPLALSQLFIYAFSAYDGTAAGKKFRRVSHAAGPGTMLRAGFQGTGLGMPAGGSNGQLSSQSDEMGNAVPAFFRDRVEFYLRDVLGFEYDLVNAVLAVGFDDVVDAVRRAEALRRGRASEDFEHISI